MEGSGASAEGQTSVLQHRQIPGERQQRRGSTHRVDMRPSLGTQKTVFGNIPAGLRILTCNVTILEHTGLRKWMVFEMSQIFWYLKMLTNIVVCYTFLSILQIGISPWPALQTTTFKSLQNIARNNRLTALNPGRMVSSYHL